MLPNASAKVLLFSELCKSWYHFFTPKMHYFTKISTLECIILHKIAFLNALFYYLARFKKVATSQTSKMCSETYFLVSGKREKRCNINFLPRKLAYVRNIWTTLLYILNTCAKLIPYSGEKDFFLCIFFAFFQSFGRVVSF